MRFAFFAAGLPASFVFTSGTWVLGATQDATEESPVNPIALVDWLRETVGGARNLDPAKDLQLFHVTDDPHEARHIVLAAREGNHDPGTASRSDA